MTLPLWFLFDNDMLLLNKDATGPDAVPRLPEDGAPSDSLRHAAGRFDGCACFSRAVADEPEYAGYARVSLREAYDILGEPLYLLAGRGRELIHWESTTRFCSVCGAKMEASTAISRHCPHCGREVFPHITVAVLVLVLKEGRALLVRARNFTGPFYGLVAGFLEPGEPLEECARREVQEETALTVGNIRYFGSQPWPYPSGLMVGFVADWLEGDIELLDGELSEAAFFSGDAPPPLPHRLSLTRKMIEWWLAGAREAELQLPG